MDKFTIGYEEVKHAAGFVAEIGASAMVGTLNGILMTFQKSKIVHGLMLCGAIGLGWKAGEVAKEKTYEFCDSMHELYLQAKERIRIESEEEDEETL